MNRGALVLRTAWYFRRTNAAVVLGVAVAVAVLAGSLIVGDSVRGSLGRLVTERLGEVDHLLVAPHFFPSDLRERLLASPEVKQRCEAITPIIASQGVCTSADETRRAPNVSVFGRADVEEDTCIVSAPLAADLGVGRGDVVVVRSRSGVGMPADSAIRMSVDQPGLLRLTVADVAPQTSLEGGFSLHATQRAVRSIWVPLGRLQRALEVDSRVNGLLIRASAGHADREDARALQQALNAIAGLADYGLRLVNTPEDGLSLESRRLFLLDPVAEAAEKLKGKQTRVLAYLANTIRNQRTERTVPYSMVAGISDPPGGAIAEDEIVLNQWAAADLTAKPGDRIELVYYIRDEDGLLRERTADFALARVVPMAGLGADRTLVPRFKGLTDAEQMDKWNPPRDFKFESDRIRPRDEQYWDRYRAAPKAFVNLDVAQQLWGTRYGDLTSVRFAAARTEAGLAQALTEHLKAEELGLSVRAVRAARLEAAAGNTDFSGLFIGFSFYLVISALLLVVLLVRLSVEQRARQIAVLDAVGYPPRRVRRLLYGEGMLLVAVGTVIGIGLSVGYAWLMVLGLRTVWNEALGTTLIWLDVRPLSLAVSFGLGLLVGLFALWRGLRRLRGLRTAELVAGKRPEERRLAKHRRYGLAASVLLALGGILIVASALDRLPRAPAFFGAGVLLLIGLMLLVRRALSRGAETAAAELDRTRLARRNAARNPTRSMLTVGLLGAATFILASVGSMKVDESAFGLEKSAGTGGYRLIAELDVPILYDIGTPDGRRYLGLPGDELWEGVTVMNMRVNAGDDLSCRNLYRPDRPRIVSVPDAMIERGGFSFAGTVREAENPWSLLQQPMNEGVPVFADNETAMWILKVKLGDTIAITDDRGRERSLVVAGLIGKSIFQGELLMGREQFMRLFPGRVGYRQLLIDVPGGRAEEVREALLGGLADYGIRIDTTRQRLAAFARIANAYISAFQMLGGLGLLLGTLGLAVVLARSVLERRGELALLSAVGFRRGSIHAVVLYENLGLLIAGLAVGLGAALVAVAPSLAANVAGYGAGALLSRLFSGIGGLICLIIVLAGVLLLVSRRMTRKLGPADLRHE